jgi:hypothetical protein
MAFGLLLPLRIAQAVFAVVILGLSGYGMELKSPGIGMKKSNLS